MPKHASGSMALTSSMNTENTQISTMSYKFGGEVVSFEWSTMVYGVYCISYAFPMRPRLWQMFLVSPHPPLNMAAEETISNGDFATAQVAQWNSQTSATWAIYGKMGIGQKPGTFELH